MEKQKSWHFYLIIAVVFLTLYNIFPTIFWYSKPLKEPVDQGRAKQVAIEAIHRVNALENDAIAWLHSYNNLLGLKPSSIKPDSEDSRLIRVSFENNKDAAIFTQQLNRAGQRISFVPAQLKPSSKNVESNIVLVERNIGLRLQPQEVDEYFQYTEKFTGSRNIAPLWQTIVYSRANEVIDAVAGPSQVTQEIKAVLEVPNNDQAIAIARDISSAARHLDPSSPIGKRYFKSLTQIEDGGKEEFLDQWIAKLNSLDSQLQNEIEALSAREEALKAKGEFLDARAIQEKESKTKQVQSVKQAIAILKENRTVLLGGKKPLSKESIQALLEQSAKDLRSKDYIQTIDLTGYHPFIQKVSIDWNDNAIELSLYTNVQELLDRETRTETEAIWQQQVREKVINSIARISQLSNESVAQTDEGYQIALTNLTGAESFLVWKLGTLAEKEVEQTKRVLEESWLPEHLDLQGDAFPVRNWDEYNRESPEEKRLGLVVLAPAAETAKTPEGFRTSSVYIIVRGLNAIESKYQSMPDSEGKKILQGDIQQLTNLLHSNGYISYSGSSYAIDPEFKNDTIFELSNYYNDIIGATREDFWVKGDNRFAVLEFTDVEQRILTENKIDNSIQDDLLQWQEDYNKAQVSLQRGARFEVPPPTKNPYWQNLKISTQKYFRGDDRKILKWGLDLSGGKTVRIGLKDQNNQPVTNPEDLNQAVNELYTRINKMGISEQTIRTENDTIVLDFPGSQAFSAQDLIQASAMHFHIVNEKFAPLAHNLRDPNPELTVASNRFLQSVWNEAVVTNRQDISSIQEIAWRRLGGDPERPDEMHPRTEDARLLYDAGLRVAQPRETKRSSSFNDTLSTVAMYREEDYSEWHGQTHPLLFVFHNWALEGSQLQNIQVGYDPNSGYTLNFDVKNSYDDKKGSPSQEFHNWTNPFAKARITGTEKGEIAPDGWRMAVILNGKVVSAPTLQDALRSHGRISGRFTQQEINRLSADLKAGSLSFTPYILSEQNVSPDLGRLERTQGMFASLLALVLVVTIMVICYRFAGAIAAAAVLFNLLIIWGVLQSLGAALTLPGLAGIVLTIGMAVDANVLVFERIREEFAATGRLASAIQAGYRKAFSAIIDSNITTFMAALVLISFDSGPIKGFAIVLMIGIVSSLFTALLMTRYFFATWVHRTKKTSFSMAKLISVTHINFLKRAKVAIVCSLLVAIFGSFFIVSERNTIFGMDFTGGYSLTVDLVENERENYRSQAYEALYTAGATSSEVEIRELSRPNQLRIQLGMSMEEEGHPFYKMPLEINEGKTQYPYEKNPRIVWVVNALLAHELNIQEGKLVNLEQNWSVMSGQLSETMRNNALFALGLALVAILIYITLRFEFKYAIGAVVALAHDVIVTLGIAALFHILGFPVEINLQVVGAIMTIIGYSLNDTIIIFDRIREEVQTNRKMKFDEIVNHSLNVTLNRTLMTSGTTLLVLMSLVLFGGTSLFGFALVMTIGVIVGTFSSLFIASPVMLMIHKAEEKKQADQGRKAHT